MERITTLDDHKKRHVELHRALDELAADYIAHNKGALLSTTTVMQLLVWSSKQTIDPEPDASSQK